MYRSSTQFRMWSYTVDELAALRTAANSTATARVQAAFKRQREAHRKQRAKKETQRREDEQEEGDGAKSSGKNEGVEVDVDCLTVAEEQKLVDSFCERAIDLGNFLKFPIEVVVCRRLPLPLLCQRRHSSGNWRPIPQTLLPLQLANDI